MTGSLDRRVFVGQYEYVDVTFVAAGIDTNIPYSIIRAENPNDIRFIDITPGQSSRVYKPAGIQFHPTHIVLRVDTAPYTTRLLLFTERT